MRAGGRHTLSLTIVRELATSLAITSPPFVSTNGSVTARLTLADGATPIAGEPITFGAGAVVKTATTDANGLASAALAISPGAYELTATYAGSALYTPSRAPSQQTVVYLLTRFVVWAPGASAGARVQFWGDDWVKQIADKDARRALDAFKGYAGAVFDRYWTARPGDAKPPRALPQYIGVVVDLTPSSHDIHDDEGKGYDGRLGERAFGTVLGKLAP